MLLLEKMEVFHGRLAAVFKVPTSLHGDVYMRVCRSNYRNDLSAVVIVDSSKFLDLWRSPGSSHDDVAHMTPDEWPSDYKFADAADGFSKGHSNPVPLADVGCHAEFDETIAYERRLWILRRPAGIVRTERRILGFTNGVTGQYGCYTLEQNNFPSDALRPMRRSCNAGLVPQAQSIRRWSSLFLRSWHVKKRRYITDCSVA